MRDSDPTLPSESVAQLEDWLGAVRDIQRFVQRGTAAGTGLADLADLLAAHARGLTGHDLCAVLLPDERGQGLTVAGLSVTADARELPGPAGQPPHWAIRGDTALHAFRTRRPVLTRSGSDPTRQAGYEFLACLPLLVDDVCLGVLVGADLRARPTRAGEEGRIPEPLTLMATQAAFALDQAVQLGEQHRDADARLHSARLRLTEHHRELDLALGVHRELLEMVLRGCGLDEVAQRLAQLVHAPVAVEDLSTGAVAVGDYQGRTPAIPTDQDQPAVRELLAGLGHGERVVQVSPDWWVAPASTGREVVGRVWVRPAGAPLSTAARLLLENAALVVAVELLKRRIAFDTELRLARDIVSDLLFGPDHDRVRMRVVQYGHDLEQPHELVLARLDPPAGAVPGPEQDMELLSRAALPVRGEQLGERGRLPLLGVTAEALVLVLPTDQEWHAPALVASRLQREVRRIAAGRTVTVVLGGVCHGLTEYRTAYVTALGALRLAQRGGDGGRIVDLTGLGVYQLLLQSTDTTGLLAFAQQVLGPLHGHDQRRRGDLAPTLRTHLAHGCRTNVTAQALSVHPNTVLNRLNRAAELLDVDLESPQALLQLQLAFMVEDVAGARSAGGEGESASLTPEGRPE